MPYRHLSYEEIADETLRKAFSHTDALFHDVFAMLQQPKSARGEHKPGFNFSISLILLCIIDGMAALTYPKESASTTEGCDDDKKGRRFKQFVREKVWTKGKWGFKDEYLAANFLYFQLRNPLVHELGSDNYAVHRKNKTPSYPGEPKIMKFGKKLKRRYPNPDIEILEDLDERSYIWPVLAEGENKGEPCLELCCASFYRTLKRTVEECLADVVASQ